MTKVMITGHSPERLKGREAEITEWINNTIRGLLPVKMNALLDVLKA